MSENVQIGLHIAATPQRVFQALTQADQLTQWFAEYAGVSKAEERYDFWGRFTPETPVRSQGRHTIRSWRDDQELSFIWQLRGATTTVTIVLAPAGEGTNL